MGDPAELLLVRIDHFRDRPSYVSTLREWLGELQVAHGRLISMGSHTLLLFLAASAAQNDRLLQFYRDRPIDTNTKGERCVDKFIDVLGRKTVEGCGCKGFLEMNVLSSALLQKVLVTEWQAEQEWLDTALVTERTKTFLEWKEAAKAARKHKRKQEGQERQKERDAKRLKREQEATQKALEEAAEQTEAQEVETEKEAASETTTETTPSPQKKSAQVKPEQQVKHEVEQQQQRSTGPSTSKNKSKNAKRRKKTPAISASIES